MHLNSSEVEPEENGARREVGLCGAGNGNEYAGGMGEKEVWVECCGLAKIEAGCMGGWN